MMKHRELSGNQQTLKYHSTKFSQTARAEQDGLNGINEKAVAETDAGRCERCTERASTDAEQDGGAARRRRRRPTPNRIADA